jgi:para-aminobenzoate synthetase/4-amino-4-deoxychorismate lyase
MSIADPHTHAPRVILRDPTSDSWLTFTSPCRILTTTTRTEVLPLLRQAEESVTAEGLFAAGYIAYEAAPAFDASLPPGPVGSRPDTPIAPLLWLGLFRCCDRTPELPPAPASVLPQTWQPSLSPEAYQHALQTILAHIQAGDTYQVNFTYRLRTQTSLDPWHLFRMIAGHGDTPYAAFVDTAEWAVCSASPELFLRLDGELITSRPMKGTAARGRWAADDAAQGAALTASAKDRAENVMIVDMVRNDLGRIAEPGSVQVPELFAVERFPTVWQMSSTVAARTQASLVEILQATFPPASITGAPKRRAMEIIAALESAPRQVYTGAIGYLAPGRQAQFNVAIRTVLLHRPTGQAEYGVGGGVVWDSTAAAEARECLTKAAALHPLRRDFDLLETLRWTPEEGYWLLPYHLQRLEQSAAYFGFRLDAAQIQAELLRWATHLPRARHRVRLLVSRQGAICCEGTLLPDEGLRFADLPLARSPVDPAQVWLFHKTTCRELYAEKLRELPGHRDALLFNTRGEITESTLANVAFVLDGVWVTPPLSCGLLPGTHRAALLAEGKLQERIVTIAEARQASAIYLLNAVRGLHLVRLL